MCLHTNPFVHDDLFEAHVAAVPLSNSAQLSVVREESVPKLDIA